MSIPSTTVDELYKIVSGDMFPIVNRRIADRRQRRRLIVWSMSLWKIVTLRTVDKRARFLLVLLIVAWLANVLSHR